MKNLKKISSLLLALVMIFGMAIAVNAESVTQYGYITIDDNGIKGDYVGYKLINSTNHEVYHSRYSYSPNDKYIDIIYSVLMSVSVDDAKTLDKDVKHEKIMEHFESIELTEADMRTFADSVYRKIKEQGLSYDASFKGEEKSEKVEQGWWLIIDKTDLNQGGELEANSLAVINTIGVEDIEVQLKKSYPEVEKKVLETNDSAPRRSSEDEPEEPKWQDAADYDFNDVMQFKVTGTVASNLASFENYYYAFHDEMTNMTFVDKSVHVEIDGIDFTQDFTVTWDASKKKLSVANGDILALRSNGAPVVNANSKLVLTYKATLDSGAVVGAEGNPNSAYVEFANDPYENDSTGYTAKDTVKVFTYKIVVNKVVGIDETADTADDPGENDIYGKPLDGAGFTLYKLNSDGEYVQVGDEVSGGSTLTFSGVDAGTYKLSETTAPLGFNKGEDIEFTIVSVYDIESETPQLRDLFVKDLDGNNITLNETTQGVFVSNLSEGSVTVYVKNYSGTKMPTTGGLGTLLMYILGAVIFATAFVLLVIKLRTNSKNKAD